MVDSKTSNRLRSNDPGLTRLSLVYPPSEFYDDLEDFLDTLSNNSNVEYVLVERRFVGLLSAKDYHAILRAIGLMKGVKEIEFWNVRVPLSALCEAIKPAAALERLGLGSVRLADLDNCEALREHQSLKVVYLSDFRFDEREDDNSQQVMQLDSFLGALSTCPNLEKLELFASPADIDPWTANGLATLGGSVSLRQITLRRLGLKPSSVEGLVQAFRVNPDSPLRSLDLNENLIGNDASTALVRALSNHSSLREINLRDNGITGAGCAILVDAILENEHVEKLNLACNPLGDDGSTHLARLVRHHSTIKDLELFRGEMTDKGCILIAQALKENTTLLKLGLSYNKMTDTTYVAVAEALTHHSTLKSIALQVDRHQITNVGCEALLNMVRDNFALETLSTLLSAGYGGEKSHYGRMINVYLRLNHAGRKKLMQDGGTKLDWVKALLAVHDNFHAVYFLVRANPSLLPHDLRAVTNTQ